MVRAAVLSDEMWARVEPVLPPVRGRTGRPFRDHRQVIEGIIYRLRTGVPWRDLPVEFGPWQTVWKRHARFCRDGTWDAVLSRLQVQADAAGQIDWTVSVDSTVVRVHQHGAAAARSAADTPARTRGAGELQRSAVFPALMASLRVGRAGPGRPRVRPDAVLGDNAYSAWGHRRHLRIRGITAVIPEPAV